MTEPNEKFYVGYRELLEKPGRKGYTKDKSKAGKFTLQEARVMTEYTCADGWARWYIPCSALDNFDGKLFNPPSIY